MALEIKKSTHAGRRPRDERRQFDALRATIAQQRHADALVLARAFTTSFPGNGLGWKTLGALLWWRGSHDEALAPMQNSARALPRDAEAHSNLGMALLHAKRVDEAVKNFERALRIDAKFAAAHYHLGMVRLRQGRYAEAQASLGTAASLRPDYLTAEVEPCHSDLLFLYSHDAAMDADSLFAEHCRFGQLLEGRLSAARPRHAEPPDPDRRIRVGFVSGDLNDHAVASFIEPVLARLSRYASVELHAYYTDALEDKVNARLRAHFKGWNLVSTLSDSALAELIKEHRIDVLVDLSGHSSLNRLRTFAHKPAPIQVSWMGYPGTTGLRAMDYYLADRHWLPPGQFDRHFAEKLVYLPAAAVFQPHACAPPVNALPALNVGRMTFGSFNRSSKINAATLSLWSQLLRALPESRLILAGVSQDDHTPLVDRFAMEGIARERLTVYPRDRMDAYLALHHQVDVCLDTFPYNGGTTTHHALWMGVPTLTIAGTTPAGRQGAGILGLAGLDEFIATDAADFVAKGMDWANRLAALAGVRAGLRERCRQSPSQRPDALVAGLERALLRMWRHWCAGLPPESFDAAELEPAAPTRVETSSAHSLQAADSATLDAACGDARSLQLAGRTDLAEQLYVAILQAAPTHAIANHCLGMLHVQLQRPAVGLPYLRAALNAHPELPDYWLGYLEALLQAGELDEATQTLTLARQHGLAGAAVDDFAQRLQARLPQPAATETPAKAEQPTSLSRAARRREERLARPHDAALLALVQQRRFDEARAQAAAMTERFPQRGLGWKILGAMLWAAGKSDEALAAMQMSARLMPTDAETHSNLGMTLAKLGRFDEADMYLRKALEIDPKFAAAHYRQGMSYELQGRYAEAEASVGRAIALRSDTPTVDDENGYSNLLYMRSHNPDVDADTLFAEHCRFSEDFEADLRASWPRHQNIPDPDRCLQIGFVSGDLRTHAVATFLEPVLAQLSGYADLQLHAYSNCALEDRVSARLRGYVQHWHPISALSDTELTQKIVDDRIDILIDLSGHTGLNRLRTFARKPAPIQVSWIGYPGTTGLRAMDYFLGDRYWLPPGQFDRYFTEKLVYLPAQAPFQPSAFAPPVNLLPALATGCVTFGSFNRLGKINAATIDTWSQLMRALPEAKMLLGGMPADVKQHNKFIDQFAAHGIEHERLTFHPRCGMEAYLALHHRVDICLDTYPYNGGTTTIHAVWMGVPTLTIAGPTPAGRSGAAVLGQVGLDGFAATDTADFVAKGLYWAEHLAALAEVRAGLRARLQQSPSRQADIVAAALGQALRHMWRRWCAGLPAESFHCTVAQPSGRTSTPVHTILCTRDTHHA